MKKRLLGVSLALLLAACSPNTETKEKVNDKDQTPTEEQENDKSLNKEEKDESIPSLTKAKAKETMTDYKKTFVDLTKNTGEKGIVKQYHTKDELISYFMKVMSKDLATWYVETYFNVENDGVYLKAMDAPTWLVTDQPFSLKKINKQTYQVIQERQNELIGHVNMIYILSHKKGRWIVDEVKMERLDHETSQSTNQKITKEKAIAIIRQSLRISKESSTKVELDHIDENGNYVIHVYDLVEDKNGKHTATVGWYIVNKTEGSVEDMM